MRVHSAPFLVHFPFFSSRAPRFRCPVPRLVAPRSRYFFLREFVTFGCPRARHFPSRLSPAILAAPTSPCSCTFLELLRLTTCVAAPSVSKPINPRSMCPAQHLSPEALLADFLYHAVFFFRPALCQQTPFSFIRPAREPSVDSHLPTHFLRSLFIFELANANGPSGAQTFWTCSQSCSANTTGEGASRCLFLDV